MNVLGLGDILGVWLTQVIRTVSDDLSLGLDIQFSVDDSLCDVTWTLMVVTVSVDGTGKGQQTQASVFSRYHYCRLFVVKE